MSDRADYYRINDLEDDISKLRGDLLDMREEIAKGHEDLKENFRIDVKKEHRYDREDYIGIELTVQWFYKDELWGSTQIVIDE